MESRLEWLSGANEANRYKCREAKARAAVAAKTRRTAIFLCLHDGDTIKQNGDRSNTLAALEYWFPRWRDLGLEFVTMTEAAEGSA